MSGPERYACSRCLARHNEPGFCPACGTDTLLDTLDPVEDEILASYRDRRGFRRDFGLAVVLWVLGGGLSVFLMQIMSPLFAHMSPAVAGTVAAGAGTLLTVLFWMPGVWVLLRQQRKERSAPVPAATPELEPEPVAAQEPATASEPVRKRRPQPQPQSTRR